MPQKNQNPALVITQPKKAWFKRYWKWLIAALIILAVLVVGSYLIFGNEDRQVKFQNEAGQRAISESEAVKAGKQLAGGKCEGTGPVKLSVSPMKKEDIAMIMPYGLMVDGHVTPVDHQYFSPANFNSAPDTYPVYAMADGRITEISHRGESVGNRGKPSNDYRFVFAHSCTFLTYFDLVTSLAPNIKAEFDKNRQGSGSFSQASLGIPVKAGQLVGYIGGQTLDFAVWNTEKPLSGFITPGLYKGEAWKIYTADPLDYYNDELKQIVLEKYLRSDWGKSGKIDWDTDGKLIGNWFQEGTNGYEGDRGQGDGRYWRGHLAVVPDYLDPTYYIASFGTFKVPGDGEQFVIKPAQLNPNDVSVATGLVKYELAKWSYLVNGHLWDSKTPAKDPKVTIQGSETAGCVLYQLLENRQLRAEPFPNQSCASVSSFTAAAKIYTR